MHTYFFLVHEYSFKKPIILLKGTFRNLVGLDSCDSSYFFYSFLASSADMQLQTALARPHQNILSIYIIFWMSLNACRLVGKLFEIFEDAPRWQFNLFVARA
mmetsp:Transcript_33045/g.42222  ORF Transcript_33045/g.42222 Transcript_33045/m.42222 type:complete len:102 (-) Transcript_33045:1376-1681(-)